MCTHLMKALGNLMPIGQLVVSKETIIVNDEGSALAALRSRQQLGVGGGGSGRAAKDISSTAAAALAALRSRLKLFFILK